MYYVYLLKSEKDGRAYIGFTANLRRRFEEHNSGASIATRNKRPWKLIYYEAYLTASLAMRREKQLKRFAKVYMMLKRRIGL